MAAKSIELVNLVLLMVWVVPIFFLNRVLGINNGKKIIIAIIRMVIQLSLVGLYLQYIFSLNNPVLNVVYILVMMFVASISIVRSSDLQWKRVGLPILVSLVIPNFLMLMFFNRIVIDIEQLFEAKYIITIGGMILGNGLSGNIVGLSTFYNGIKKNIERYQYDLALGATRFEALLPYYKEAVLVSINPTIASIATIGLVSLPGMMTGQILGGSIPVEAIRYQFAIMIAIFATKYFNIFMAIWLSSKSMFNSKDQIQQ